MDKEKNSKKEKRILEIKELAEIATQKINENKILNETISIYQTQINIIKEMLDKKSKLNINKNESTINSTSSNISSQHKNENENINTLNIYSSIKKDFLSYYQQLKRIVEVSREIKNKLLQKCEMSNSIIFDDTSLNKMDLNKNRIDIFILDYEIKQKNDIIKKLIESISNSKKHAIFREPKRETETNRNSATNQITSDNLYLQRDLQVECKNYNRCINRHRKKEKNIEKMKETKKSLKKLINYFEEENKINKKAKINKSNKIFNIKNEKDNNKKISHYKKNSKNNNSPYDSKLMDNFNKKYKIDGDSLMLIEEEKNKFDKTYLSNDIMNNNLFFSSQNMKTLNKEKEKKKKIKQKFNFLTVDELFDLNNEEGEKEVIIQEELHSDDEVVFVKKIKNKNRICTEYLTQIKKQVPGLYFNQIEFNKKKVMNEADLYSYQRREYNKQNIDENIKTMKKKIKIMKKRININSEKLKALIDFDKKVKEQYKVLKPIKVLSSVKDYDISFMKKEFYNYKTKKNAINDIIAEVDEKKYTTEINNINNTEIQEEDDFDFEDNDDYSDKMRKRNIKTKKDYNNSTIITKEDNNGNKNKINLKKNSEYDNDNKAKSK